MEPVRAPVGPVPFPTDRPFGPDLEFDGWADLAPMLNPQNQGAIRTLATADGQAAEEFLRDATSHWCNIARGQLAANFQIPDQEEERHVQAHDTELKSWQASKLVRPSWTKSSPYPPCLSWSAGLAAT